MMSDPSTPTDTRAEAFIVTVNRDETFELQTFGGVTKAVVARAMRLLADEIEAASLAESVAGRPHKTYHFQAESWSEFAGQWRAMCHGCNWRGPWVSTEDEAMASRREHGNSVRIGLRHG